MNVEVSTSTVSAALTILGLLGAIIVGWVTFQARLSSLEGRVNDLSMTVSANNEAIHMLNTRQALLSQRVDDLIFDRGPQRPGGIGSDAVAVPR